MRSEAKPTKGRIERNIAIGSTYRRQPRANDIMHCNIFVAARNSSGLSFEFSRDFFAWLTSCRCDNNARFLTLAAHASCRGPDVTRRHVPRFSQ